MVGLGGLPIAHDDVEDFEGGPGVDGVQWIGRKGVRGQCLVLMFLPGVPLPLLGSTHIIRTFQRGEREQQDSITA